MFTNMVVTIGAGMAMSLVDAPSATIIAELIVGISGVIGAVINARTKREDSRPRAASPIGRAHRSPHPEAPGAIAGRRRRESGSNNRKSSK
jgi:hypothetical protein